MPRSSFLGLLPWIFLAITHLTLRQVSGLRMEITISPADISPQLHTSNIATISPSLGGVGHNVALAIHRAGGNIPVRLCSSVVDDL